MKSVLVAILLVSLPSAYASSYADLHLDPVGGVLRDGYNVTFSGMLTTLDGTPIQNRAIFIEDNVDYPRPDMILAITTTDPDGKFLAYWKAEPKESGNPFNFYALFIGGKYYGFTTSETYQSVIQLSNKSSTGDTLPPKTIPSWFVDASKMWHDGQIRNIDYYHGIENLEDYGIIKTNGQDTQTYLPSWLKNDAGWLSDGEISKNEFVNMVNYVINDATVK